MQYHTYNYHRYNKVCGFLIDLTQLTSYVSSKSRVLKKLRAVRQTAISVRTMKVAAVKESDDVSYRRKTRDFEKIQ